MIKIVIPSHPMVKKNGAKTSMFYKDKRTGRLVQRKTPIHYYSKAYLDWAKTAVQSCAVFRTKNREMDFPLTGQYHLTCLFFLGKNIKVDLSALYEGVQDVLSGNAAGNSINVPSNIYQIIEDDSNRYIVSHDGSRVYLDYIKPRTEIYLRPAGKENSEKKNPTEEFSGYFYGV